MFVVVNSNQNNCVLARIEIYKTFYMYISSGGIQPVRTGSIEPSHGIL